MGSGVGGEKSPLERKIENGHLKNEDNDVLR